MVRFVFAAVLLLVAPLANADEPTSDLMAVEKVVFDYFHGQGEASEERLSRAFATDKASMIGVVRNENGEETLRAWKDMEKVVENWSANKNPPGTGRIGKILDVNIVDGRIATVMFKSSDRFYDALTLAKLKGQWKIIAKAFVLQ